MNIDQIKYFIEVAEIRHLSHASENLNISEPALSKAIAKLEDEIGTNLFDRIGRNIYLSKNGEIFLPYAKSAIKSLSDGINEVAASNTTENKHVKLQSMPIILFPNLLDMLLIKYPDISIIGLNSPAYILEENLITKKTDICFTSRDLNTTNLKCILLFSEPVFLIVPKNHPFSNKEFVRVDDILNEKYILTDIYSSLNLYYNTVFKNQKSKPEISLTISNINEAFHYISKEMGVAITSKSIYQDLFKRESLNVISIPIIDTNSNHISINQKLYYRKVSNSEEVIKVKSSIVEYFKKYNS